MENSLELRGTQTETDEFLAETRQQIFEKFHRRMLQMAAAANLEFCPELNADVIVISHDQSWLFEAQNARAAAWLHRRCGTGAGGHDSRERIRVHPCVSPNIVAELKAAGFEVHC